MSDNEFAGARGVSQEIELPSGCKQSINDDINANSFNENLDKKSDENQSSNATMEPSTIVNKDTDVSLNSKLIDKESSVNQILVETPIKKISRNKTGNNNLFLTMFCCIGNSSNSSNLKVSYLVTTFLASSIIFVFLQELVISQLTNGYSIVNIYDGYLFGPPPQIVFDMGALDTNLIRNGQLARLFWSFWLHTGFIHLVINLTSQIILGIILETRWVIWRYTILYFIGGLSGNLASAVLDPCSISAGSSACFFALLAGIIVLLLENWKNSRWQFLYVLLVILASLVGISLSFMSNTDNWAHIGGFIAGLLWSLASMESFPKKNKAPLASLVNDSRTKKSSLSPDSISKGHSQNRNSSDVESGWIKHSDEVFSIKRESMADHVHKYPYFRRFIPENCACSGGIQTIRVISFLMLTSLLTIGFLFLLYKPIYTRFNLTLGHLSFSGIQECSCCNSPEGLFWCSSSPTWTKRCG
ncbi:putative rhomboid protease ROM4 [Cryptosporidium felis]|nr:putative rhomboid protease ROM4 [Cryptosporidium felis]